MTLTTRSTTPRRPPRTAAEVAKGIGASLLLLVLVLGIPAGLLLVAPLQVPSMPTWTAFHDALTSPDNGHLFLGALTVVAWLAWVAFSACVLTEAVGVLRGRPSWRLPLLAAPQRGAAALVATAAVLLAAHPLPTPTTALRPVAAVVELHPTSSVLAAHPHGTRLSTTTATANGSQLPGPPSAASAKHPQNMLAGGDTVTVQRGDTLWGLAERILGSGSRYTEIATLNYGRVQPDGRALTSAHWIYPGWVLLLPPSGPHPNLVERPATPSPRVTDPPSDTPTGTATSADTAQYTVHAGDTLWGIAATLLHDPQRYTEIYELNAGHPQLDGGRLTDPGRLTPGWVLRVPDTRAPTATPYGPTATPRTAEPEVVRAARQSTRRGRPRRPSRRHDPPHPVPRVHRGTPRPAGSHPRFLGWHWGSLPSPLQDCWQRWPATVAATSSEPPRD